MPLQDKKPNKKELKKMKAAGMTTGKIKKAIGVIDAFNDPVSPERLGHLKSYQKALEIQEYAKKTLLPCVAHAEEIMEKADKASRIVTNHAGRLSQPEDPKTSGNYRAMAGYLGSHSPEAPGFIIEGFEVKAKLSSSITEYHKLLQEGKGYRETEACTGVAKNDEDFQKQNGVINALMNVEGTVNRAITVFKTLHVLIETIYPFSGGPMQLAESEDFKKSPIGSAINNGFKIQGIEIAKSQKQALKQQATEQEEKIALEKQKELQLLTAETKGAIEKASNLAMERSKTGTFDVAAGLQTSENPIHVLLITLQEKIETTATQVREFDNNSNKNNSKEINRVFNNVFALAPQENKTIVEAEHYQFLKFLYKLNQEYYLGIKEKLINLSVSDTSRFAVILSDLEKIQKERIKSAKNFLEQYHIKDASFLTKLLVPVHRAVFRFKKEYLEPIVKLAVIDKQKRLRAELEAASAKLKQQIHLGVEFYCEQDDSGIRAYMLGYETRLNTILDEPKELAQYIEDILTIEQEIKRVIFDPMASVHVKMLTQQKMLLQQRQAKEQEQKRNAEMFTAENFKSDKLPLLRSKLVLEVLERLFDHPANVTFTEFQSMLCILRGKERSAEPIQGHHMLQFPCLWNGYENAPQVLVAPFHTSGMSTQAKIEDDNIIRDLRNACMAAGMGKEHFELLKSVMRSDLKNSPPWLQPSGYSDN